MNDSPPDWREALEAGRFEDARRLFLLVNDPQPEVRRAIDALADVQESVREKDWSRARRRLERLEERPPLVDWVRFEEELAWLEGVSRSSDGSEPLGVLQRLEGREYHWFEAEAANQRGTALIHAGEVERARNEFEEAVRLDPNHFRALTNLGNALLELGATDRAIECYRKALTLNEEFANAHHNLGVAYRRKGNVSASVRHLRRAERVRQRVERERGREEIGRGAGASATKMIRWSLWALVGLVVYLVLRNRGIL